ncbi:MAG: hypothetical protein ABS84_03185 [Rubrivivax sp. SCN 71-131]|jgi:hypothetical protein|nr:MAG: hypothetical protein ABS84_03185 [Rubrivivax sp. SCN 71-131]
MIYKFRSKAGADLIMLGGNGDEMLRILGREPASKGIIEPADMPAARRALEAALAAADAAAAEARAAGEGQGEDQGEGDACERRAVGLRQRLWPMLQLLERAAAAGEPIVWGV